MSKKCNENHSSRKWNFKNKITYVAEKNVLYSVCGYIVKKIKDQNKHCNKCLNVLLSKEPNREIYSEFTFLRCYKMNALIFVSKIVYQIIVECENVFRHLKNSISEEENKMPSVLMIINEIEKRSLPSLPTCHNIRHQLIKKFLCFRFKIWSTEIKRKLKSKRAVEGSSKSIAIRSSQNNYTLIISNLYGA